MKEASGELNMTVVTIVAIAAVLGFFMAYLWPKVIQPSITGTWNSKKSEADKYTTNGSDIPYIVMDRFTIELPR